ncbi:hypothetical protein [Burkholderia ubonensis]|uniref:hypothetical protein n=1 Tax=Burkholderia ubonensis TaxID=101571 RepID=UPI0012F937F4|nr:hypothetical protein [Burkholderia ubonensis]
MQPYTRNDNKGRTLARDDIHHRTADLVRAGAKKVAKSARHAARQAAQAGITRALREADDSTTS